MRSIFTTLIFLALLVPGFAQVSENMTLVGHWDDDDLPEAFYGAYNEVWGYTDCEGNEYAILGSSGFVHFFDLADPSNPQEIASFEGGDVTVWRDIKSYQDHIYTVCDGCSEGMMIFDMSQLPDEVIKVDQTEAFFSNSHNIFIDEDHGRLYAAGTNTMSWGLIVLDIATDPDNPSQIAQAGLDGGYVHDLYVRDHIVYANSAGSGLYVYDFTDANDVQLLGTMTDYEQQGYNHSGWLTDDGETLVMIDETHNTGIKLVDVSNLASISVSEIFKSTLLEPQHTNSIAHNPYVRGDYALISYYHDGVQVWDISDQANPTRVGYYDTDASNADYSGFQGNWGLYVGLPSGLILGSDFDNGLHVLSLDVGNLAPTSAPSYPDVELAFYDTTACKGDPLELLTTGDDSYQYEWMIFDAILPDTDNPGLMVDESGSYSVIVSDQHCSIVTDEVMVNFLEAAVPTITYDMGVLSSSPAESYQWYYNGDVIPYATGATYEPTEEGMYMVETTDANGCTATSDVFEVFFQSINTLQLDGQLNVSPVPAEDYLLVEWNGETMYQFDYTLVAVNGQQLIQGIWDTAGSLELDLSGLASGMYMLQLRSAEGVYSKKIIRR